MRRLGALLLAFGASMLSGCTLQATQQFTNRQPGRAPRTTEVAMDFRPGGPFVGGELVMEAAPEGFGARGAHARAGYAIEPTPGSGEVWSVDLGGTMGAGRPPFSPNEVTMYEAGFLGDLALRLAGPAEEPGVMELTRFNLSLVVGARARTWPAADGSLGEISAGAGLRGSFDSDARSILQKVTKETANAFGL
jgi:hypothetical protein